MDSAGNIYFKGIYLALQHWSLLYASPMLSTYLSPLFAFMGCLLQKNLTMFALDEWEVRHAEGRRDTHLFVNVCVSVCECVCNGLGVMGWC